MTSHHPETPSRKFVGTPTRAKQPPTSSKFVGTPTRAKQPAIPQTDYWRDHGIKIIKGDALDVNTAQTPGMNRAAAITAATAGAQKIWAGTVTIHAGAKTGAHHHGDLESVIYVVRGRARMRWGENLQYVAEAGLAILFSCRLLCRTKKLMPMRDRPWNACWCAPAKTLWW